MKAEIELNSDPESGAPILKIRHHDKDGSLEQVLLGRFIEGAKKGLYLAQGSSLTESGTTTSWDDYEIRTSK